MEYCLVVLWLLRERIRRKQTENAFIFQRNIVLSHSSMGMTDFLAKQETRAIAKSPYSCYCEFFMFSKLKIPLRRTRHASIETTKNHSLKALFNYQIKLIFCF